MPSHPIQRCSRLVRAVSAFWSSARNQFLNLSSRPGPHLIGSAKLRDSACDGGLPAQPGVLVDHLLERRSVEVGPAIELVGASLAAVLGFHLDLRGAALGVLDGAVHDYLPFPLDRWTVTLVPLFSVPDSCLTGRPSVWGLNLMSLPLTPNWFWVLME